jgi:hypothetical protein
MERISYNKTPEEKRLEESIKKLEKKELEKYQRALDKIEEDLKKKGK